jgi:poly-gamma-glutamate synthesis protein (capsule biosynthesis protein)
VSEPGDVVTLCLTGDIMLGRGVDQILPHPGDPRLIESYVRDARAYVELAEAVNGDIPRPVDVTWPWGVVVETLEARAPQVRIVNLETSVTTSDDAEPGKPVHYRMHPSNLGSLGTIRPDVTVLANNHVLDYGRSGLLATLDALADAGLRVVGAGRDEESATRPVAVPTAPGRRVTVCAAGMASSGIPPAWAAAPARPGVAFASATTADADRLVQRLRSVGRPGDVLVASVHWGSNWGYDVPREHVEFAHRLVDGGVDVVHGHSSHHPRPIEVYQGRLILYGCGDLVDDYEGITGYERYRDDLRLLYLATVDASDGGVAELRMVPLQARRLRLEHASAGDGAWLADVLDRVSRDFGCRVDRTTDGDLVLR